MYIFSAIRDNKRRKPLEDYCQYMWVSIGGADPETICLAAVSDGIGSCDRSDEISEAAVTLLFQAVIPLLSSNGYMDGNSFERNRLIESWGRDVVYDMNKRLMEIFAGINIGATLSFAVCRGDYVFVRICGDSPVFLHDGVKCRLMFPVGLDNSDRYTLRSCLGLPDLTETEKEIEAETGASHCHGFISRPADTLILCSDGACEGIDEEAMAKLLTSGVNDATSLILDNAETADDQSIILIRFMD